MAFSHRLANKPTILGLAVLLILAVGGGAWWLLRPTPYQQGQRLEAEERYEEAVVRYQEHLKKEPTHRDAQYRLAVLLTDKLNRPGEARQYADQLLAAHPEDVEAALVAGRLRVALADQAPSAQARQTLLSEAAQMFEKVLGLDAQNPIALFGAARVEFALWSDGQTEAGARAEALLKRLLAAQPDDTDGHLLLAQYYVSTGRHAEALPLAQRATQLAAQNEYAYHLLAWARLYAESPRAALESANTAVGMAPGLARNHHVLGIIYLALDNLQQAENELKRAYDFERANLTYVRDYVRVLRLADKLVESRDLLTPLMQEGGGDPNLLMTLYSIQYRLGNRDAANAVLQQYIQSFPGSPEALLELASSLYESHLLSEAVETYTRVLEIDPNNAVALYNLGTIELDRLNYTDAETYLTRARDLAPDLAKARLNLGNVYFRTGRFEEARQEYEEVRRRQPHNAIVLNNLGLLERRSYQQSGDAAALQRAQRFFQEAYEKDPGFIYAMLNQALLLSRQGQFEAALELLDRVIQSYGREAPQVAFLARAFIRLEQGDFAAAEQTYRQVVRDSLSDADKNLARNGLAVALYKQGRFDEALEQLDAVVAQEGDRTRPLALSNRAMVVMSRDGPLPETRQLLSDAIELEDLAEAHANLARLELLSGNFAAAVAENRRAQEHNELLRGVHYNEALALERAGQMREAEAAYRQELRVNPGFLDAALNLGLNLLDQERADEAMAVLSAAEAQHPNTARLQVALAMVHLAQANYPNATLLARRAASLDPRLAAAHSVLAVVAVRENRLDDAERAARAAVDLDPASFYAALNLASIYALAGKFDDARHQLDRVPDPGADVTARRRFLNARIAILVNMGLLERARQVIPESLALQEQPVLSQLREQIDALEKRK
ncbi:tetratricopeptide repeat protein [bacterium]|nr:tetratricopeptide repeat protein [bacterium]